MLYENLQNSDSDTHYSTVRTARSDSDSTDIRSAKRVSHTTQTSILGGMNIQFNRFGAVARSDDSVPPHQPISQSGSSQHPLKRFVE